MAQSSDCALRAAQAVGPHPSEPLAPRTDAGIVGRNRFIAPLGQAPWIAARGEGDGAIKRLRPTASSFTVIAELPEVAGPIGGEQSRADVPVEG